jgi:hypothetical protein
MLCAVWQISPQAAALCAMGEKQILPHQNQRSCHFATLPSDVVLNLQRKHMDFGSKRKKKVNV